MAELLTIPEAAKRLRISRSMLYQLMAAGHLRGLHLGRKRLFTATELDAYVEAQHVAEAHREPAFR